MDAGCRPRRAAEVDRGRDGSPRDGRLLRRKRNDWLRTSLDGAGNQNRGEMSNRSEAHRSDVRPGIRWGEEMSSGDRGEDGTISLMETRIAAGFVGGGARGRRVAVRCDTGGRGVLFFLRENLTKMGRSVPDCRVH